MEGLRKQVCFLWEQLSLLQAEERREPERLGGKRSVSRTHSELRGI